MAYRGNGEVASLTVKDIPVCWDPKVERRLVWKVDLILMPIMTFSYGLQFYDKLIFSSAAVFGMLEDLQLETPVPGTNELSSARYSTASAAFYWGYIIGVLPIALILQRLPVVKALSALIFLWGVVVFLMVTVTNFHGAIAQRFFLGMIESAVSPGFVLLCSIWYTKTELPLRLGIWYSATGIFTIFSSAINFAIGHAHGALAPWKYMYLAAGSITILWSLFILAVLPETPATAHRLFNEQERAILVARMKGNLAGADNRQVKWHQVREAFCDFKIWLLATMGAAVYVTNGGVTAFGTLVIKSFGYSSLKAILMQDPGGAAVCVSVYMVGYLSGRFKNTRTIWCALSCLPVLAGAIILWKGSWHQRGLAVFGYSLLPVFAAPYLLILSLAASNVAGGTKKACATGAIFIGYNVGNIIGPYLINTKEVNVKYRSIWIAIIVVMSFTMVSAVVLRILLARENARRDKNALATRPPVTVPSELVSPVSEKASVTESAEKPESAGFEGIMYVDKDLTDWEDKSFRYTL
ncbi:MFS general substrate transporter [Irpex rosettiformis]|uniref:MFS general substrate transporter n=1 Tax=Irpex rosettiformis TaxID=378272 RepID=A0ACB8TPV7_9APHY|nr:MFS general substrate transporter [Irpex rosettiformis]